MTDTIDDAIVVGNQNGNEGLPMVINSSEVDIQISTALKYPRSIKAFKEKAVEMATLDEATAASCMYTLPRAGKPITGPSVRLAEICASAWKNLRVESRVAGETDREVIAEATCWDLENNIAIRIQNRRKITNKNGMRFSDDMIIVTGNSAISIALRNAIFRVIPKAYVNDIFLAARQVAIGEASTLSGVRANVVEYFGKMGVTPERILTALDRPSLDDVGLDDIAILKGYATAIKDGQTTVDEAFPLMTAAEARAKSEASGGMAGLKERMASTPQEPEPEKPEPEAPEAPTPETGEPELPLTTDDEPPPPSTTKKK
jgi:hypothetical protein